MPVNTQRSVETLLSVLVRQAKLIKLQHVRESINAILFYSSLVSINHASLSNVNLHKNTCMPVHQVSNCKCNCYTHIIFCPRDTVDFLITHGESI